jgi:ATP-dependent exoDNAse (exonuclease V) beta subunit
MKTFTHNLLRQHDKLAQVIINEKRHYWSPDGSAYPSVTTVLSSLNKEGIMKWRKRVGEKEANKITTRAANRGTKVHNLCEKLLRNEKIDLSKEMPISTLLFGQLKPFLEQNIDEVLGIEIPLYSYKLKSAGTCDLICKLNNVNTILDFKTSLRPKKEEWITTYFYQTTAYAIMAEELYDIKIPNICIAIAVEDDHLQIFTKDSNIYRSEVTEIFRNYFLENYS